MENKQSEKDEWKVIDLTGGEPEGAQDLEEVYDDEGNDDEFDDDDYLDDDGRYDAYV